MTRDELLIELSSANIKWDTCFKLLAEYDQLCARAEQAEAIINGMFPMWIAAMGYCEHGRAADLDRMRNYYNGRDNPLTSEQLHTLFEIQRVSQLPKDGN